MSLLIMLIYICERSEFTSLPGVDRVILPLKGSLHLFYEGHGEKVLAPYEQDSFDAVSYTHLDVYKRQELYGRV